MGEAKARELVAAAGFKQFSPIADRRFVFGALRNLRLDVADH